MDLSSRVSAEAGVGHLHVLVGAVHDALEPHRKELRDCEQDNEHGSSDTDG